MKIKNTFLIILILLLTYPSIAYVGHNGLMDYSDVLNPKPEDEKLASEDDLQIVCF